MRVESFAGIIHIVSGQLKSTGEDYFHFREDPPVSPKVIFFQTLSPFESWWALLCMLIRQLANIK